MSIGARPVFFSCHYIFVYLLRVSVHVFTCKLYFSVANLNKLNYYRQKLHLNCCDPKAKCVTLYSFSSHNKARLKVRGGNNLVVTAQNECKRTSSRKPFEASENE